MEQPGYAFRKATVSDVKAIHRLINDAASEDAMLPRSLSDLYEKVRDFHVCESGGRVLGCCALHIIWEDMAEIRSLAVQPDSRGKGLGVGLVRRCLAEREEYGIRKVFVLTYIPGFFEKLGFRKVSKDILPHKVWSDCVKCPKFPDCGETAMITDDAAAN